MNLHTSGTSISYRTLLNSPTVNNLEMRHLVKTRSPDFLGNRETSISRFGSSRLSRARILGRTHALLPLLLSLL